MTNRARTILPIAPIACPCPLCARRRPLPAGPGVLRTLAAAIAAGAFLIALAMAGTAHGAELTATGGATCIYSKSTVRADGAIVTHKVCLASAK